MGMGPWTVAIDTYSPHGHLVVSTHLVAGTRHLFLAETLDAGLCSASNGQCDSHNYSLLLLLRHCCHCRRHCHRHCDAINCCKCQNYYAPARPHNAPT